MGRGAVRASSHAGRRAVSPPGGVVQIPAKPQLQALERLQPRLHFSERNLKVGPTVIKFDPEARRSTAFVLSLGAGGGTVMPASTRLSYLAGKLFLATDGGIVLGYDAN